MKKFLFLLIFVFLVAVIYAQTSRDGITIPANTTPHPWLYWRNSNGTPTSRVATAQSWVRKTSYPGYTSAPVLLYDSYDLAFTCYIMGNNSACNSAMLFAVNHRTGDCTSAGEDTLRSNGGNIGLIYDTMYTALSSGIYTPAITSAGSGQTPGTYTVAVLDAGSGKGGSVSIVVTGSGTVTARPTVLAVGSGYTAPYITFSHGGTPAKFSVSLALPGLANAWLGCQHTSDGVNWGSYGQSAHIAFPANNYFNGHFRNNILYGIAMYYDDASAPTEMLDVGLGDVGGTPLNGSRANALEAYASPASVGFLRGTVQFPSGISGTGYGWSFNEGSEYGILSPAYATECIPVVHTFGRNVNSETTAYVSAAPHLRHYLWNKLPRLC